MSHVRGICQDVGSGGRAVDRAINRGDSGSVPLAAVSKIYQLRSSHVACVIRNRY